LVMGATAVLTLSIGERKPLSQGYQWISNTDLIYVDAPDPEFPGFKNRDAELSGGVFMHRALGSAESDQLAKPSAELSHSAGGEWAGWVTGNGRWTAWYNSFSGDWHCAALDGSRSAVWRNLGEPPMVECPGSRSVGTYLYPVQDGDHVIQFDRSSYKPTRVTLRSIKQPNFSQPIPLPDDPAFDPDFPFVCLSPDHVVAVDNWRLSIDFIGTFDHIDIVEYGLRQSQSSEDKVHRNPLPFAAEIDEVALSPDGTRFAALLLRNGPRTLIPPRGPQPKPGGPKAEFSLWCCRIDGGEMHEIGNVLADAASPRYRGPDREPSAIRWLPDGKRVSFVYKNSLYVADAVH
jgi:hypothetical protein